MKKNQGITLIALVITIIILIILAAVSISILMGEDGLITKAKQGALNYQNAALEEQEMLNNFYGDFATEIAKANGDLNILTRVDNASSATSDKILKDYKAYVNGALVTGTMNNYSQNIQSVTLTTDHTSDKEYEISSGYHEKIKVDASAVYNAGVTEGTTNGTKVYYLGEGQTFDLSVLLPNDYTTLTVDNFMIDPNFPTVATTGTSNHIDKPSKSYDATTGIFTCGHKGYYSPASTWPKKLYQYNNYITMDSKVYVIVGTITNL